MEKKTLEELKDYIDLLDIFEYSVHKRDKWVRVDDFKNYLIEQGNSMKKDGQILIELQKELEGK